ncbi:hypothetical protein ACE6H2_016801 [Prunus campanulata]
MEGRPKDKFNARNMNGRKSKEKLLVQNQTSLSFYRILDLPEKAGTVLNQNNGVQAERYKGRAGTSK